MIRCLDIHTHLPAPKSQAVISCSPGEFNPLEGQLYSVGIHPWDSQKPLTQADKNRLRDILELPEVAAVGECGIDIPKGGFLYKQVLIFNLHITISEELSKPLIIHDVKAHDVIVGLRRDLKPKQNWVVHGFRGKPTVAKMLTDAGIYISFGEKFNSLSPAIVPPHMILAETDESQLSIEEIINQISLNLQTDMLPVIEENTKQFLNLH